MDRYFEIIDSDKVRGGSNLEIAGIKAGYDDWKKKNFLPRNGIVGHLIGEGSMLEGPVYILECAPKLYVPILPDGVKEVSSRIFDETWRENIKKGRATQEEIAKVKTNEIASHLMNSWGL